MNVRILLVLSAVVVSVSSMSPVLSDDVCMNGGKLMFDGSCFCPPNLTGSKCQTLVCPETDDPACDGYKSTLCVFHLFMNALCPNKCGVCPNYCTKPCQNGGELNSLACSCDCPLGYSGDLCQNRDCSYQSCSNGGVVNPHTCECICPSSGVLSGEHCEIVNCTNCAKDPPSCDPTAKCLICNNDLLAPTCPHLCDMCSPASESTSVPLGCSCTCRQYRLDSTTPTTYTTPPAPSA